MSSVSQPSRRGLRVAAGLMIAFGLAEVGTGFTHEFLGLSTSRSAASTLLGASIGLLYIAAGTLVLRMRRRAAMLAIVALALDIAGRVAMVWAGFYPLTTSKQTFSILAGTFIAAAFAVYVGAKWRWFRSSLDVQ